MSGTTDVVRVDLGARAYDVRVGGGLLARAGAEIAPLLRRPRVAVITDETVGALHLEALRAGLGNVAMSALALPPGEATKGWPQFTRAVEWLLAERVERRDIVIALGGGVIGDLAGFAAAVLRRGVRFVQIPTSLLAQVDSSVGGKTGINSARLEANGPALARGDRAARQRAVTQSVTMKARIVERDETEEGDRALLNLGHTFCHALEAATGFGGRLLHGEGVAIGCALAFELSQRLGLCSQEDPSRVRAHLKAMGMKCDLADIPGDLPDADGLIALMGQDKKVVDGRLRFILAHGIGRAFVSSDVDLATVRGLLQGALRGR